MAGDGIHRDGECQDMTAHSKNQEDGLACSKRCTQICQCAHLDQTKYVLTFTTNSSCSRAPGREEDFADIRHVMYCLSSQPLLIHTAEPKST